MTFDKAIPELTLSDLDALYLEGEDCDKRIFAEMRTNLQLVAGEHYVREGSKYWNRVRDSKQLTSEQRLKLTKNHIQRVTKIYRNAIEGFAPGVAVMPANENDLQSQKAAELNQAYWNYIKRCEDVPSKIAMWIKEFVEIGEVCVKVYWDTNGGQIVGYEAVMAPDETGAMKPVSDPNTGEIMQSDKPVYGGKLRYETFEAYNLRRDASARTMEESPYLILSKLIPKKALKTWIKDPELAKKFESTAQFEYSVFDNNSGSYRVQRDQALVKEIYWRPGPNLLNGWFTIWSADQKVAEGELPYGVFPIIHMGFDEQTGNPRFHSIIRHARPPQIEINRCASKIAEHQVTLGDDKAWIPANTKVTQGAFLPGVRINTYSGVKPEVVPGRAGDQYFGYLEAQINELYDLVNLKEVVDEQPDSQDLYTNLFRSFRFKKKFAIYGEKFERFLVKVVETSLAIAKKSASDQEIVPAIGKNEAINMPEFKNSQDIHYSIKLEPRSEDIESQFGKQITLNHILQYVGPNLEKEDIGQLLRLSPFLNKEKSLERFTRKYDSIVNDILALDRGQFRPPRKYDDHKYVINMLSGRMSQSDYEFLPQPIQALYEHKIQMHEMMEAQAIMELQQAQAGFIPSGGYSVACDFYEGDPENPNKVKRVRIPSESLNWLIERLKKQNMELQPVLQEPEGVLQDMARMLPSGQQQDQQPPSPYGGMNA